MPTSIAEAPPKSSDPSLLESAPRSWRIRGGRLPRTLFGRLVLALFSLMVLASVCQIFVVVFIWRWFQKVSTVELYRATANEIARQLEPQLSPNMTAVEMNRLLFKISSVSPELNTFLVTQDGKVVGSKWGGDFQIRNTDAIAEFLSQKGSDHRLIWGENPVTREPALFSAAPISLPQGPGYVYALLGTRESDVVRHSIGDSSIALASVFFGILALGSTTGIGLLVFRQITRRYRQNSEILHQFESGNYEVRLQEDGADEVAAHARAFNRMAETIVATISKLEQVDASRRALIAAVTHDLRRPLTNIDLAVQRIQMKASRAGDEGTANLAGEAKDGCEHLEKLIEDLFELSRLEAGETLRPAPFSFNRLWEKVSNSLRPIAERQKVELVLKKEGAEDVSLIGDEEKILRLLGNLTENALLYSGEGSQVCVTLSKTGESCSLSVRDNGRGISASDLPHLFDWFYRGETGLQVRPNGTGLGLAICKRIAELHRSDLRVESEIGKGTCFTFSLPFQLASHLSTSNLEHN